MKKIKIVIKTVLMTEIKIMIGIVLAIETALMSEVKIMTDVKIAEMIIILIVATSVTMSIIQITQTEKMVKTAAIIIQE